VNRKSAVHGPSGVPARNRHGGNKLLGMSGHDNWFDSARVVTDEPAEHPHDTEDLVRLVRITRAERGLTEAQLAAAAGVPESVVRRFEAAEIVPAQPLAMRFIEAMNQPGG